MYLTIYYCIYNLNDDIYEYLTNKKEGLLPLLKCVEAFREYSMNSP